MGRSPLSVPAWPSRLSTRLNNSQTQSYYWRLAIIVIWLEQRAGPQARAVLEQFLEQVKEVEAKYREEERG